MNDELVYDDFEEFEDLHELYDQREVASLETAAGPVFRYI